MRDRGLGDGKLVPQLGAGTLPLTRDHLEHLHPPRIGQGFGDQLELLVGQGRPSRAAGFHGSMVIELSSSCQEGTVHHGGTEDTEGALRALARSVIHFYWGGNLLSHGMVWNHTIPPCILRVFRV